MKLNKVALALLTIGIGFGATAQAADADRIAQLEAQMKVLMAQLEALKTSTATNKDVAELKNQVEAQGKEAVVMGDIPNSFRVPGSDTSVHLYGVAEVDMVKEWKGDGAKNDYSTFMPYMPLRGSILPGGDPDPEGPGFLRLRGEDPVAVPIRPQGVAAAFIQQHVARGHGPIQLRRGAGVEHFQVEQAGCPGLDGLLRCGELHLHRLGGGRRRHQQVEPGGGQEGSEERVHIGVLGAPGRRDPGWNNYK